MTQNGGRQGASTDGTPAPRALISVCMCTYHRPHLKDTLESLARQDLPEGVDLEIIVVDNDKDGSGRATVDAVRDAVPFPITYDVEPVQGISHARNRTLSHAKGDWIAFLDDDELAAPDWLRRFYEYAVSAKADVLMGPVDVSFEVEPPVWVKEGGFFKRPDMETGTIAEKCRTSNAFVRAEMIRKNQIKFNEDFSRTGGEDIQFFLALRKHGAKSLNCAEAVVSETIPPERVSMEYLMERVYTQGQSYARTFLAPQTGFAKLKIWVDVLIKLAVSGLVSVALKPFNPVAARRFRIYWSTNLGKLQILMGKDPRTFYN